jgi:hypothetical protein
MTRNLAAALDDANQQLLERDEEFIRLAAARDEELRRTRDWATTAIGRLESENAELKRQLAIAQALIEEMRATPFWKPGRAYAQARKRLSGRR